MAEEWSGLGRVVEVCHPMGPAPANPTASALTEGDCSAGADWRVLPIANVSHEGINFSQKHLNRVIYFIDEDNSGSIYKMVLKTPGDYAGGGQTFVLKARQYLGDAVANWNDANSGNDAPTVLASRFGMSVWEPITDANGAPLEGIMDPHDVDATDLNCAAGDAGDECRDEDIRPGRVAADDVGGTPFGRPEDMAIGMLPNGNEILYVTTTSEHGVISIEETDAGPVVRSFASEDGAPMGIAGGTPKNLDLAPTTGRLNSPDNLAIDSLGNIYIIEDAPNSSSEGGDVWFARDTDSDGVAESLDHFLSLQVDGSEATGMIFNPTDPTKFIIAVQHPTTTSLSDADNDGVRDADGFGDAVWEFDVVGAVPPRCDFPYRNWVTFNRETHRIVRACSFMNDYNATEQMDASDTSARDFPNP
ncbi:MAG: alkaline phosphatase PhoX [Pseudomonadota bacterium]|nr:alkaline phosphatase PhoX [Pseudomonadota bacterium]